MGNQRLIFIAILSFLGLLIWQAWEDDHTPIAETTTTEENLIIEKSDNTITDLNTSDLVTEDVPQSSNQPNDLPSFSSVSSNETITKIEQGTFIKVHTDVLEIWISLKGGTIYRADLLEYPVSIQQPDLPFRLLTHNDNKVFIVQTGLRSINDLAAPNHYSLFTSPNTLYELKEDQEKIEIPLHWQENGISVTKTFVFYKGQYLVDIKHEVKNTTDTIWTGSQYRQIQRTNFKAEASSFVHTYTGALVYNEEIGYKKVGFNKIKKQGFNETLQGGWVAMIQHYFVAALVPDQNKTNRFYTKLVSSDFNESYVIGLLSASLNIKPGTSETFATQLYVGPKKQQDLKEAAPKLELSVDYGWFSFIAQPLYWILKQIHNVIGNWGFAIIIITILIKLAFYHLSAASYRSMAKMRAVHPRLQALKERYGNDQQRLGQAMMELYRTEKINPLGGCLPVLVQIPVFIGLYWMLIESVELRQAPFILWIQDLSIKDPFFILPLLMGATMFIQQKLNPPPTDPIQEKVLSFLPIIFTFFFAFFPAGLVLYWLVNNVLSIAQQWLITRAVEKEGKKA